MDLKNFQRLCTERANGRKTELEFWKAMKESYEDHEPGSEAGAKAKQVLMNRFENLIRKYENLEARSVNDLALEAEAWLRDPELGLGGLEES